MRAVESDICCHKIAASSCLKNDLTHYATPEFAYGLIQFIKINLTRIAIFANKMIKEFLLDIR